MLRTFASAVALLMALPVCASIRAVITSDAGGATIVRASGAQHSAGVESTLAEGDRLTTADGNCELHFSDGSILGIAPRTEIRLSGSGVVQLSSGRVALQRSGATDIRIDTEGGSYAPAPDSICSVTRDRRGRDSVTTLAGLTELRTRNGAASLRSGDGALIDAHGTPIVGAAGVLVGPDLFERWFLGRVDPQNVAIAAPTQNEEIAAGSWTIDSTRELYNAYAYDGPYPIFTTIPLDYGYGYTPYGYVMGGYPMDAGHAGHAGHAPDWRDRPAPQPDPPHTAPAPAPTSMHAVGRASVAPAGSRGEAVAGLARMPNTSITVIADATLGHPSYRPSSSSSDSTRSTGPTYGGSTSRGWTVVMGGSGPTAQPVSGFRTGWGGWSGRGFSAPTAVPSAPRGGGSARGGAGR